MRKTPVLALAFLATGIAGAAAQQAAPPSTIVDLSGFLSILLQAIGAILLAIAGVFGALIAEKLRQRFGIRISAEQASAAEGVATKAVTWAITRSSEAIRTKGWDHPDVHSLIVQQAADYALRSFPDWAVDAGFDISTTQTRKDSADRLANGIMRRVLPNAASMAAASPATPPAPTAPIAAVTNLSPEPPKEA